MGMVCATAEAFEYSEWVVPTRWEPIILLLLYGRI
jgi:hypothetical protein